MDFQDPGSLAGLKNVVDDQPAVLAYFSHQNCSVCRVLKPKVSDLIENNFPRIALYYINILEHPEAAAQYSVFAAPTILVFFEGKEYIRESRHVSLAKFYERLEKLYGLYFR